MARRASATDMSAYKVASRQRVEREVASPTVAILTPPANVSPTRRNRSSICRPGSTPILILFRRCLRSCIARLPDSAALANLIAAAATAYGAPVGGACRAGTRHANFAAAGRGACAARPRRRAVADLCRTRSRRAARRAPRDRSGEVGALGDFGLAILTNPNNPDGRLIAKEELIAVARKLQSRGGIAGRRGFHGRRAADASLAGEVEVGRQRRGVALVRQILRSRGFAAWLCARRAGPRRAHQSRLGHGPCQDRRSRWARRRWPIGPGSARRERLAQAANRLDGILTASGLDIVGGTTLFRLVRSHADANSFIISAAREYSSADLPIIRNGCVSACRRRNRTGSGCRMPRTTLRWPPLPTTARLER